MSLSGSTDFNLTARDVIRAALRKLGRLAAGQEPDADIMADAKDTLNLMLKSWQKHDVLWLKKRSSVALIADTASYTLTENPRRIYSARYRNATGQDYPVGLMSDEEYDSLVDKATQGRPTQYWVDYQQSQTVLHVWPVPSIITSETIQFTYQSRFDDVDSLNDHLDVTQEALETIVYNLAARLLPETGVSGERAANIRAMAQMLKQDMLDDSRDDFVTFAPERVYG